MNKFRFKVSTMLEQVEDDYIKFVGDNYGVNRDEFLKDFKAKLNLESPHVSTVHAELIEYEPNRIIIQTSKYNTIAINTKVIEICLIGFLFHCQIKRITRDIIPGEN